MAQDSRTVNDIINNAFYLLGEISPDVVPSASDVNTGLYVLNDLLDSFSGASVLIPFIKTIDVTLVPNQGTYVISNIVPADFNFNRIVELDFVTVTIQQISYPVNIVDRAVILNQVRFSQGQTRPGAVFMDNLDLQTNLTFYPKPDQAYSCQIRAKFMFDRLSLFQVITEVPPKYYRFLKYALARELLAYYPSGSWSATTEDEYKKMLANIETSAEINVLINPDGLLMTPYQYVYNSIYGVLGVLNP
jgi:hypothetical protein